MFNLGFSEILVLAVIGLLVLGPEQLPVVARKVARALNQLKHMVDDAMAPVNEFKRNTQDYIEKAQSEVDQVQEGVKTAVDGKKKEKTEPEEPPAKPAPLGLNDNKPRLDDE